MIMASKIVLLFLYTIFFASTYCQNFDSKTYYESFNDIIDFGKLFEKIEEDLAANNITIDPVTLLTMFDASTKIPSGLIGGQLFDLGNFDECYNIENEDFYGKYCLGTLPLNTETKKYFEILRVDTMEPPKIPQIDLHPQPRLLGLGGAQMGLRFAVCVPSVVKASSISGLLQFSEELCQSKDTAPSLSTGAIVTIVILSVFMAIIVASTVFDIFLYYTDTTSPHELLIAFSFLSNGRKIFSSTTNPDQLLCLNGIKAISMMWVIIGHEYSLIMMAPISNLFYILLDWQNDPANMFIEGATVSVDTFFVVGGLVTVYTFLRSMDKGVKFNVVLYYIHRYLRLTPALGIMALIHIYLLNYFGNGPLWAMVDSSLVKTCEKAWWSTLLYVTNYVREGNCLPQTWYLSVDMQLFVLSPLVLLPLLKWPVIGISILGLLTLAGVIVPFGVAYGLDLGLMTDLRYMLEYYSQTYTRFGPYVMGMLLGYIIYSVKKSGWKLRMPPQQVAMVVGTAWFISLAGLVACVYAGHDVFIGNETDRWARSLYTAINRPAWSLALSGVIFLCVTGYGGPINAFLSLPIFQFLTKLSYAMYLVHYTVITSRYALMRQSFKFSNLVNMHNFWGDFMFTLAISLILCLAFESPIIIIEKYLFGRGKTLITLYEPNIHISVLGSTKPKRVEKKLQV